MRNLLIPTLLAFMAIILPTHAFAQQRVGVPSTYVDCSGTITTGGTSQVASLNNTARRYVFIQNPIAATEPLQVNIPSAASNTAASYELAAGGTLTFDGMFVPTENINVNAVTSAHRFICKIGY